MRRRPLITLLALASALTCTAASCLSPTLPLPPPEVNAISASATEGQWRISGSCVEGAIVTVFDDTSGEGVLMEDRSGFGHWVIDLSATQCDTVRIWQEVGGERSVSSKMVVAPWDGSGPADSPLCH
jgi:hypothetical protein